MRQEFAPYSGLCLFVFVGPCGEKRILWNGVDQSSILTKQLRELEADGFLSRRDFQEIPPHAEYTLSDLGKSFLVRPFFVQRIISEKVPAIRPTKLHWRSM
ncbi:MAG: helix-turn-helix transcriptional regulator [Subdoligranulum sp.]|nr:helix-turn-helix transcriptional regulator [Subdoligranulum sp.]